MAFKYLIIIAVTIVPILSIQTGAPADKETCSNLKPRHRSDGKYLDFQKGNSNYTIKTIVESKGKIRVELSDLSGKTPLQGFILQARRPNSEEAIGTWEIKNTQLTKLINCGGKSGTSVTHTSKVPKENLSAVWIAPAGASDVVFKATVLFDYYTFWNIGSNTLRV